MRGFLFGFLSGMIVIPMVGASVALSGRLSVDANAAPPRWETALARQSFAASVARQATKLQNPIAPTGENLRAGMKIFFDACSGCHGDGNKPSQWGTSDFYPRVPQFASEPPNKPDWQLFWIVKHGVRYSGMGGVSDEMADERVWKVATFLSHIKTLPPDVEAEWRGQLQKN